MIKKKVFKVMIVSIMCLSLILGQGVLFAAGQDNSGDVKNSISQMSSEPSIIGSRLYVVDNGVRVRTEPNTSSTILGLLYFNNRDYILAKALSDDGHWVFGFTNTGEIGWVSRQYLTFYPYNG